MEIVPTSALRPADWNPRVIYTRDFQQLMRAISSDPGFLEARPVLAMQDGTIYAGEQRYRAVLQLYREGWTSPWGDGMIPAQMTDITLDQAKARAVRDNTHAGEWQEIELAEALTEIAAAQGAEVLPTLGFGDAELQNILAAAGISEAVDPMTGRTMRTEGPASDAQGLKSDDTGQDGTVPDDAPNGDALTIVLRFKTIGAWDQARWEFGQRWLADTLGHDGVTAYDHEGYPR
jgi:ParB-like chromosome segregation protein Spo0J